MLQHKNIDQMYGTAFEMDVQWIYARWKMQFTQLKRMCLYSDNIYYKNANNFHFI